jgi:hypothetical protein
MLPWQFANIQALDLNLQQVSLEGDCLYDFLFGALGWHPEARHNGVYVAPHIGLRNRKGGTIVRSSEFTLIPTDRVTDRKRLDEALNHSSSSLPRSFVPPASAMRVVRAKPLVHLTLRIPSKNWWTWTDDPNSTDVIAHHLGLDPAIGDGGAEEDKRPTSVRMLELARQRRGGQHPVLMQPSSPNSLGWAHIISKLPDLKTLELVLETFVEKKAQLEKVAECAKTWRFPIADTQFELAWDGKVEEMRWSKPVLKNWEYQLGHWYTRSTDFEVRTIKFTRRTVESGPTHTSLYVNRIHG